MIKQVQLCIENKHVWLQGQWQWDLLSTAVYCSDVMSFPDDFEGTKSIVHPDDIDHVKSALNLLEAGETMPLQFRIITTYGDVKTLSSENVSIDANEPVLLPDPEHEPWETAIEDWSDLKEHAQLKLRAELADSMERQYELGTWYINTEANTAYYSDNMFRIHGLPPQSLNAHANTFTPFIHPDDHIVVTDTLEKAYAHQVPVHLDYRIVKPNGEVRMVQLISSWRYNYNGHHIFSGVLQDITNQNALSDKLADTETLLAFQKSVLQFNEQHAGTANWYINLFTKKTTYSDNYFRIYGLKQQILPKYNSFLNLVHTDDRETVTKAIERMYREHVLPELEFRIVRPDGKIRYLRQHGRQMIQGGKELVFVGTVQDITVQKGLERKVQEQAEEKQLQAILNELTEDATGSSAVVWYLPDENMHWTDAFFKLLGYKPGGVEPLQRLFQKSVYPADLKLFNAAIASVLKQQPHDPIQFRVLGKGNISRVKLSFYHVQINNKPAVIGLVQDITTQTTLQEQVAERTAFAALLGDAIPAGVIVTNSDHTITTWSRQVELKTGIKSADALYENLFEVLPRLKNEDYVAQLQSVLHGESTSVSQARDGYQKGYYDLYLTPIRNEQNEVTGVLHVLQDVTKERELQVRLSERLNFIENLVEASVDRIIVLDRNMNYLYWNQKAEQYYGISKNQVLGKNILEKFPAFRNDPTYTEFRRVLKGETVHVPAFVETDSGEYFETYLIPIKNDKGEVTAVLWVVHDLSNELQLQHEQARAARLLEDEHRQLKEAQAIGKIGSFEWKVGEEEVDWSDEMYRINGLEPQSERITMERTESFVHPEDYGDLKKLKEQSFTTPGFYQLQHRIVLRDGTIKHVSRQYESIADESGRVVRVHGTLQDITEQQKILNELERANETLRVSLDSARAGMGYWNHRNGTSHWDERAKRIIGFSREEEEKAADAWLNRIHEEDRPKILEQVQESTRTGKDFLMEYRVVQDDGSIKNILGTGVFKKDAAGKPTESFGIVMDITELKKTEQDLKEKVQFIQSIATATADILSVMNLDTKEFTYINRSMMTVLGYTAEQAGAMQTPFFEVMDSRDRPAMLQHIADMKTAQDGEVREIEYRMICADGGKKWYKDRNAVFERDSQGVPLSKICISEDITERKRKEDELFKNLNLLKQSEEVAGLGTWDYKIGDTHMNWSEGMYELFDLKQGAKVTPETYVEYAIQEDRPIAKAVAKNVHAGAESFEDTLTIQTKDGARRVLKVKGIAVKDREGKPVRMLGVDLDITELVKTEETLKALNRSLDQRNKELEAKNEELANFSFIASHDLREPLRKIHTFSDWLLLRENEHLSKAGQDYLKRMSASVERMDQLIDDVLVLTRLHAAAFEEEAVDLNTVLKHVKSELSEPIKLTKAQIKVTALPTVTGNKNQLQYLFKNLISNAIKFQKPGNQPQLTIQSAPVAPAEIVEQSLDIERAYTKVCISDNGIGIDKKYTHKIFQIFQRLHARTEYEGTGIGLTICKKVMENHHGTITVESTPGNGTMFCCYFSVAET